MPQILSLACLFRQDFLLGFNYSPNYIQTCLSKHPEACVLIIKLFHTRFCSNNEDENQKQEKISILKDKIEGILAKIDNLVDDKIIRMFVELCFAVLRTNYYLQLFAQP